eukprot:11799234-Alexandrium_andersonii.AAC.1
MEAQAWPPTRTTSTSSAWRPSRSRPCARRSRGGSRSSASPCTRRRLPSSTPRFSGAASVAIWG